MRKKSQSMIPKIGARNAPYPVNHTNMYEFASLVSFQGRHKVPKIIERIADVRKDNFEGAKF